MSAPSQEARRALEGLRWRALEHWLGLEPDDAAAWLEQHGLLSIAGLEESPPGVGEGAGVAVEHGRILQRQRRRALAANLHRMERFQALTAALGAAGIPCCPLKGIHLLGTLYSDDPEHRPMADVDVLVPAASLDGAVTVLGDELSLTETLSSRCLAADSHERVLVGPGLVVEVHRRLGLRSGRPVGWRELDDQGLLTPGELLGASVHRLAPPALVVHLASQFIQHGPWTRLVRAEDLLRLAPARPDSAVRDVARQWGVGRRMVAAKRAFQRSLGANPLPGVAEGVGGTGHLLLLLWEILLRPRRGVFRGRAGSRWQRNAGLVLLTDDATTLPAVLARKVRQGGR